MGRTCDGVGVMGVCVVGIVGVVVGVGMMGVVVGMMGMMGVGVMGVGVCGWLVVVGSELFEWVVGRATGAGSEVLGCFGFGELYGEV